eukprot:TRINITY_DN3101_c0_g1_i1.p2 TRINITY_DN3101_c0_g1~~TRINITY_DN3101_c0_g1_i1.p2  ORF type:complete len:108 (+),score=23.74 TRINITY_DN3101_c0_g1_i1:1776-2099(+)
MDISGKSDPYCKISYGNKTYQTKIVPKSLNPSWNETFLFHPKELKGMLLFEVWDHDFLTPDDFMGSVFIKLENIELSHVAKTHTLPLEGKKQEKFGEITVQIALQHE